MRRGSRHPETLQNQPDASPDRFQRPGVKSHHHGSQVELQFDAASREPPRTTSRSWGRSERGKEKKGGRAEIGERVQGKYSEDEMRAGS
eukprot:1397300-Pyramimonas_sp.AAC.1